MTSLDRVLKVGVAAALAASVVSSTGCRTSGPSNNASAMNAPTKLPTITFQRPTLGEGEAARTVPVAVYTPPGYDPAKAYPLIVFLHGSGERGDDGLRPAAVGLGPAAVKNPERWPFIIAFPQIRAKAERAGESVGGHPGDQGEQWMSLPWLPAAVAEWVGTQHAIDADRVYLTGLSNGGGGTWSAASATPGVWAAIAPVCGWDAVAKGKADAAALAELPAWAFHGENDTVIPPSATRSMEAAVKAAGGDVRATYFEGVGHDAWNAAYADPALPEWLLGHTRRAKVKVESEK